MRSARIFVRIRVAIFFYLQEVWNNKIINGILLIRIVVYSYTLAYSIFHGMFHFTPRRRVNAFIIIRNIGIGTLRPFFCVLLWCIYCKLYSKNYAVECKTRTSGNIKLKIWSIRLQYKRMQYKVVYNIKCSEKYLNQLTLRAVKHLKIKKSANELSKSALQKKWMK